MAYHYLYHPECFTEKEISLVKQGKDFDFLTPTLRTRTKITDNFPNIAIAYLFLSDEIISEQWSRKQ